MNDWLSGKGCGVEVDAPKKGLLSVSFPAGWELIFSDLILTPDICVS